MKKVCSLFVKLPNDKELFIVTPTRVELSFGRYHTDLRISATQVLELIFLDKESCREFEHAFGWSAFDLQIVEPKNLASVILRDEGLGHEIIFSWVVNSVMHKNNTQ